MKEPQELKQPWLTPRIIIETIGLITLIVTLFIYNKNNSVLEKLETSLLSGGYGTTINGEIVLAPETAFYQKLYKSGVGFFVAQTEGVMSLWVNIEAVKHFCKVDYKLFKQFKIKPNAVTFPADTIIITDKDPSGKPVLQIFFLKK